MTQLDLRWTNGELVGPDGELCPPLLGSQPDARLAHEVVDSWMADHEALRQYPSANDWSFGWTLRTVLFFTLYDALAQARALYALKEDLSAAPSRVVLHEPPESWWPSLVQGAFPDADVSAVPGDSQTRMGKLWWYGVRARQAWTSARRLRRLPAPDPTRPRVLVLSRDRAWSGTEDRGLGPVIDALEQGGFDVVVLAVSGCDAQHRRFCMRTRPKSHLFGEQVLFRHLRRHGMPQAPDVSLGSGRFEVDGMDLTAFVAHVYEKMMKPHWVQQHVYAQTAPEFLKEIGAQAVVMSDENSGGVAWKMGLMRAGLPIVAVQHGIIAEDLLYYAYPKETDPKSVPLCPVTCVYGPRVRDVLVDQSIYPESSVAVTGQAEMDLRPMAQHTWGEPRKDGEHVRRDALPKGCDRLLLFASQHPHRRIYGPRLLRALAESNPRNFLVVRPHPLEAAQPFWDECIRRCGVEGRVAVSAGGDLREWLDACDVLVGCSSTVLSEAAAMARPVLVMGSWELGDGTRCVEHGVATDLSDFTSLDEAVDFWLECGAEHTAEREQKRLAFIASEFSVLDGHAGERIAGVVERVIAGDYA